MEHGPSDIASRLEEVLRRLDMVEHRLSKLESTAPATQSHTAARPETAQPSGPTEVHQPAQVGASLSLIGRTLVVLGGAFLLRAITGSGVVPQALGTAIALAYAVYWFILADRAAQKDLRSSAIFHGLAASIIAFPLLWEATAKYKLLGPFVGAIALLVVATIGLGIAWRRKLNGLAWLTVIGGIVTAWSLAFATRTFFPFIGFILLLGLATLWMAYLRRWSGLAFVTGSVANLSVLVMTVTLFTGSREHGEQVIQHGSLLTLQFGLLAVYLASIAARTLLRDRDVAILEILQAVVVFMVGMGGAIALVSITGSFQILLGVVSLVFALSCYAVSFSFIDRRSGGRRNFIFYSTSALFLTLVGLRVLMEGAALAIAFAVVAVLAAWLGTRKSRATLSGHGAFYITAAAIFSGLLRDSFAVFMDASLQTGRWLAPSTIIILAVAAVCFWLPVATHGRTWGRLTRLPKVVVLIILLCLVDALLMSTAASLLSGRGGSEQDTATTAAARTGILALTALALALLARQRRFPEALWMLYAVLAAGALKLLLEDLRSGRPATLFVSLVLYGGALILAPRLARRGQLSRTDADAHSDAAEESTDSVGT